MHRNKWKYHIFFYWFIVRTFGNATIGLDKCQHDRVTDQTMKIVFFPRKRGKEILFRYWDNRKIQWAALGYLSVWHKYPMGVVPIHTKLMNLPILLSLSINVQASPLKPERWYSNYFFLRTQDKDLPRPETSHSKSTEYCYSKCIVICNIGVISWQRSLSIEWLK